MLIEVGNKAIGEYLPEENRFRKVVSRKKHLFKKADAWGIDGHFFTEVLLPNNVQIEIYDKDEKITYTALAQEVKDKGQFLHFKPYGIQVFLSRVHWTQSPRTSPSLNENPTKPYNTPST